MRVENYSNNLCMEKYFFNLFSVKLNQKRNFFCYFKLVILIIECQMEFASFFGILFYIRKFFILLNLHLYEGTGNTRYTPTSQFQLLFGFCRFKKK